MENSDLNTDNLDPIRLRIDESLKLLRAELAKKTGGKGGRETALAITKLEEAGMWVNRAAFVEQGDYTPLLKK